MTVPKDKQASRVFHGMIPEYYHRVVKTTPSPDTDVFTFWYWDYGAGLPLSGGAEAVSTVITVTYTDGTRVDISTVARTFPEPSQ